MKKIFYFLLMILSLTLTTPIALAQTVDNNDAISMIEGASIRTVAPMGLRFQAKINKDKADNAKEIGMYIAPTDLLNNQLFPTGDELNNAIIVKKPDKTHFIKKVIIDKQTLYTFDANNYQFNVAITNIKKENLDRDFSALAYVDEIVANNQVNRSIAFVANKAFEDGKLSGDALEYVKGIVYKDYQLSLQKSDIKIIAGKGNITVDAKLTNKEVVVENPTLTWTTDNECVQVNNGVITPVSAGTATVTATYEGVVSASCTVEVLENADKIKNVYKDGLDYTLISEQNDSLAYSVKARKDAVKDGKKVIIADEFNGIPVTEVGKEAFHDGLTHANLSGGIVFGKNIKKLNDDMINSNATLKNVDLVIPGYMEFTSIAFRYSVVKSITFSEGIKSLYSGMFNNCRIGDTYLPSTLENVGSGTFQTANLTPQESGRIHVPFEKRNLPQGWAKDWASTFNGTIIYKPSTEDPDAPDRTTNFVVGGTITSSPKEREDLIGYTIRPYKTNMADANRWIAMIKAGESISAEITFKETGSISYVKVSQLLGTPGPWDDGRISNIKIELYNVDTGAWQQVVNASTNDIVRMESNNLFTSSGVCKTLTQPIKASKMRVTFTAKIEGLNIKAIEAYGVKAN